MTLPDCQTCPFRAADWCSVWHERLHEREDAPGFVMPEACREAVRAGWSPEDQTKVDIVFLAKLAGICLGSMTLIAAVVTAVALGC